MKKIHVCKDCESRNTHHVGQGRGWMCATCGGYSVTVQYVEELAEKESLESVEGSA